MGTSYFSQKRFSDNNEVLGKYFFPIIKSEENFNSFNKFPDIYNRQGVNSGVQMNEEILRDFEDLYRAKLTDLVEKIKERTDEELSEIDKKLKDKSFKLEEKYSDEHTSMKVEKNKTGIISNRLEIEKNNIESTIKEIYQKLESIKEIHDIEIRNDLSLDETRTIYNLLYKKINDTVLLPYHKWIFEKEALPARSNESNTSGYFKNSLLDFDYLLHDKNAIDLKPKNIEELFKHHIDTVDKEIITGKNEREIEQQRIIEEEKKKADIEKIHEILNKKGLTVHDLNNHNGSGTGKKPDEHEIAVTYKGPKNDALEKELGIVNKSP